MAVQLPFEPRPGVVRVLNQPLLSTGQQTFWLDNKVDKDVKLTNMSFSNLSPPFARAGGTCVDGMILAANTGSCSVVIAYTPTDLEPAAQYGSFDYTWADASQGDLLHQEIHIEGTAHLPVLLVPGRAFTEPVFLGSSYRQRFALVNLGGAPATAGTISDEALGLAPPFALAGGSCASGVAIAPLGGHCTLDVAFTPAALGTFTGTLAATYDFPGLDRQTLTVPLYASGVEHTTEDCFSSGCAAGRICVPRSDTSGAGICIDVPEPPTGCMAPCIWEARKKCLPVVKSCTHDTPSSTDQITCDVTTRWAVEIETPSYERRVTESRRDGQVCLLENRWFAAGWGGSTTYTDGRTSIASASAGMNAEWPRSVHCSDGSSYTETISWQCDEWKARFLQLRCQTQQIGSCSGL
jgi:hypothetical protein